MGGRSAFFILVVDGLPIHPLNPHPKLMFGLVINGIFLTYIENFFAIVNGFFKTFGQTHSVMDANRSNRGEGEWDVFSKILRMGPLMLGKIKRGFHHPYFWDNIILFISFLKFFFLNPSFIIKAESKY